MKKRCRTSWFSSDFRLIHQAEIRGIQDVAPLATYHGEIGREAGKRKRAGTGVTLRPQRQRFACETAKAPRTSAGML